MKVSSIAVVSPSNTPLYISTFDERVKLQALIHSSLDVLEERVALGCKTGPNAPADQFLGLLSISEGFKVYGAISNTTRFLVATTDVVVREEDVKLVLGKLRYLYTDTASNPFYDPGTPLGDSPKFVSEVGKIASAVPRPPPPPPHTFTV